MEGQEDGRTRTFLFTDIEGSTRLWEQSPEAMVAALGLHNTLIQSAVAAAGGRVFKSVGDAICAVFPGTDSAIHAAIAAQRALHDAGWASIGLASPLMVRMAIQSGSAQETAGDFAGPVLNRLSRLLGAGHGGQILLADAPGEAIPPASAPTFAMRDLGERRLRDIPGSVRVIQLTPAGLPDAFPPLNTLDLVRHNLPSFADHFFGRGSEILAIRDGLASGDVRVATLVGPGGIGKTRLAVEICHLMIDQFADGVWLIDLSTVRNPHQLVSTVMQVLELRDSGDFPDRDLVIDGLRNRETLLLLDNCEHIIEAAADLAATIIRNAPSVRILATSREPLHIRGEQRVPVGPLPIPDRHEIADLAELKSVESVQLFVSRAASVFPGFALDLSNAMHVSSICRQVDGIPLAIEIAATRIDLLTPAELNAQLTLRLPSLIGGPRDLPARHQTLRDAIAWSYELLPDPEKQLFRQLSVFAGGWDVRAAESILKIDSTIDVGDAIDSLASKTLAGRTIGIGEDQRYSMLETIREFAQEKATASGELEQIRPAHAVAFLARAERLGDELATGIDHAHWLRVIEIDYANMRAGFDFFVERKMADEALLFSSSLWLFWSRRGWLADGRQWLESALSITGTAASDTQGDALRSLGNLSIHAGDLPTAVQLYQRALLLARGENDLDRIGRALCNLGLAAVLQGRWEDASALLEEDIAVCQKIDDVQGVATAYLNIGMAARDSGNPGLSLDHFERSLALHQQDGNESGIAYATYHIGLALLDLKRFDQADATLLKAETAFDILDDADGKASTGSARALILIQQGNVQNAQEKLLELHSFRQEQGDRRGLAECCEGLALAAARTGDMALASHWLTRARDWRQQAGIVTPAGDLARLRDLRIDRQF